MCKVLKKTCIYKYFMRVFNHKRVYSLLFDVVAFNTEIYDDDGMLSSYSENYFTEFDEIGILEEWNKTIFGYFLMICFTNSNQGIHRNQRNLHQKFYYCIISIPLELYSWCHCRKSNFGQTLDQSKYSHTQRRRFCTIFYYRQRPLYIRRLYARRK